MAERVGIRTHGPRRGQWVLRPLELGDPTELPIGEYGILAQIRTNSPQKQDSGICLSCSQISLTRSPAEEKRAPGSFEAEVHSV